MKRMILKVGAFILRDNCRVPPELLLFTQPDSNDAPIQIPGGTVEPDEPIETALWREVAEETGLTDLRMVRKVGVSEFPSHLNENDTLKRHCYLLSVGAETPDHWIHRVGGTGEDGGMRFAYEWRQIEPDFKLVGDLGVLLNPRDLPELYG